MKIRFYRNEEFKIIPASENDFEVIKKMQVNEVYESDIKKTRNYKFLQKYMVLIKKGFENSKTSISNKDFYRSYIQMKAGYYESVETPKGIMTLPKSISFENMEDIEFSELYNNVFNQIIIDIEADEQLFRNELQSFI